MINFINKWGLKIFVVLILIIFFWLVIDWFFLIVSLDILIILRLFVYKDWFVGVKLILVF